MQSGELYVKSNVKILKPKFTGNLREFSKFLDLDGDILNAVASFRADIRSVKIIYDKVHQAYESELIFFTDAQSHLVNDNVNGIQSDAIVRCQRIMMLLRRQKSAHEAQIMQSVLKYFSILKDELDTSRSQLSSFSSDTECLRRQAKLLKNMKQFGLFLKMETRDRVILSALPNDSTQSKRCRKAVKDNINSKFLDSLGFSDIEVANVFKLEHFNLSEKLQATAVVADKGKVKGLFCVVSPQNIFAFIAFGLFAQQYRDSSGSSPQKAFPNLFCTPWYCSDPPELKFTSKGHAGAAATSQTQILRAAQTLSKSFGNAQRLALAGVKGFSPSFTRYSTPRALRSMLEEAGRTGSGVFLALCRVLICRLRTVAIAVGPSEIEAAHADGYDAVYSTLTEEYTLLQGQSVLPEFIMQVQLIESLTASTADSSLHSPTGTALRSDKKESTAKAAKPPPVAAPPLKIPSVLSVTSRKSTFAYDAQNGSTSSGGSASPIRSPHRSPRRERATELSTAREVKQPYTSTGDSFSGSATGSGTVLGLWAPTCGDYFAENDMVSHLEGTMAGMRRLTGGRTNNDSAAGAGAGAGDEEEGGDRDVETGAGDALQCRDEGTEASGSHGALLRKQNLVLQIEESVGSFSRTRNEIVRQQFSSHLNVVGGSGKVGVLAEPEYGDSEASPRSP